MKRYPSLTGRRRVLVAASASASLVVVTGVLDVVASTLSWMMFASQQSGLSDLQFTSRLGLVFLSSVPFALGVLLSLWLVAPVAAELRITQVISRSLLAVAIGAVVTYVIQFGLTVVDQWSDSDGRVFGFFVGVSRSVERSLGVPPLNEIYTALSQAIALLPLTVLVCVLTWMWLQRHPHALETTGQADEV